MICESKIFRVGLNYSGSSYYFFFEGELGYFFEE